MHLDEELRHKEDELDFVHHSLQVKDTILQCAWGELAHNPNPNPQTNPKPNPKTNPKTDHVPEDEMLERAFDELKHMQDVVHLDPNPNPNPNPNSNPNRSKGSSGQ